MPKCAVLLFAALCQLAAANQRVATVREGLRDGVTSVNVLNLPKFAGFNTSARHGDIRITARNVQINNFRVDSRGNLVVVDLDLEGLCGSHGLCCKGPLVSSNECGPADPSTCCIALWLFPPENSQHEQVFVKVQDENEHLPLFPSAQHTVEVSENQRAVISLPMPVDDDYSQRFLYIILQGPEPNVFSNNRVTRMDLSTSRLTLNLAKELDREVRDSYQFAVHACETERFVASRCGTMNVTLNVLDVNDNPPRFNLTRPSNFSVRETDNQEVYIATLAAQDRDEAENAHIRYDIEGEPKCLLAGPAAVVPRPMDRLSERTAFEFRHVDQLWAVNSVDYETCRKYSLTVVASNAHPSTYTDTLEVQINVLDVDDWRPTIQWVPSTQARVAENSKADHVLSSFVMVSDYDTPLNRLTCKVEPADLFTLKPVLSSSTSDSIIFNVLTLGSFDREHNDKVNVDVRCWDRDPSDAASGSEAATLLLEITDENDNIPLFEAEDGGVIVLEVEENAPLGTALGKLSATDRDSLANAELDYSFANRSAYQLLNLDSQSGLLTTAAVFDFEAASEHRFVVLATDRGIRRQTGSATLLVRVADLNDNTPLFSKSRYEFRVSENAQRNELVGSVLASDRDHNASVTYRFAEQQDHFLISSETGNILVYNALDRESMQSDRYSLTVIANDSVHSATAYVEIVVEDQNDCKPHFVNPTALNNSLKLACSRLSHCVGSQSCVVMQVQAKDDDASAENARVKYFIANSSQPQAFSLNADSGELSYRHEPTQNCFLKAELVLVARDAKKSDLFTTLPLTVFFSREELRGDSSPSRTLPAYDASHTPDGADSALITTNQLMIILVVSAVFVVCAIGLLLVLLSRMHVRKSPVDDDAEQGAQQDDDCEHNDPDDSQSHISSHDADSMHKQDELEKMEQSEYGGTVSLCSEAGVHDRNANQTGQPPGSPFFSKSQPLTPLKRGLLVPRRNDRAIATLGSRTMAKSANASSQPYVYYSVLNGAPVRSGTCESPASHTTNSCFECSMQQQQFTVKMKQNGGGSEDEHAYASAAEYDPACACSDCVQVRMTSQPCSVPLRFPPSTFKFAAVHTVPSVNNRYNVGKLVLPPSFNTMAAQKSSNNSSAAARDADGEKHSLLIQRSDGYLTTMPRMKPDGNNNGDADKSTKNPATAHHTAACPPDCTNPRCLVSYV